MAEFDPTSPKDATEAACARALLGDDTGREERRARLMAALPRPDAPVVLVVAPTELARPWQPWALGLLAAGLLVAAVLALKGRPVEPRQEADPRLAAAPPASTAVVVAQAELPADPVPAAATRPPRAAAKAGPPKPTAAPAETVVVAEAASPQPLRESEAGAASAVEPAAAVVAAAPPRPLNESATSNASDPAEALARAELRSSLRARAVQSLAASDADSANGVRTADALLLAAVSRADLAAVRAALQAGASAQTRDAQGRTALMLAARTGARDVVDLLLAAGARKVDRDPRGWTAADHAEAQGRSDLIDILR